MSIEKINPNQSKDDSLKFEVILSALSRKLDLEMDRILTQFSLYPYEEKSIQWLDSYVEELLQGYYTSINRLIDFYGIEVEEEDDE